MTKKIDFLNCLTTDILCQIFSKYLSIEDVSRFDISICNHEKRRIYLRCIDSIAFVWLGDKEIFDSRGINWLSSRNIKIRHLKLKNVFNEVVNDDDLMAMKISGFGMYLQSLTIKDEQVSDFSITRISKGCPNIQNLNLSYCSNITDESIIKIAEMCKNMQNLDLYGCDGVTDLSIIRVAEMSPNLQCLNLYGCLGITDVSVIRISQMCPNMQNLNLGWCNITDESINRIAEGCPAMQDIDISGCSNVTDMSVDRFDIRCKVRRRTATITNCI
jgi:F-box/leucine-rich repeat protein 2/20